jgi:hypothetical protein
MTQGHSFWFFVTWACVVWYSLITGYVAFQGLRDIRGMLRRLKEGADAAAADEPAKQP